MDTKNDDLRENTTAPEMMTEEHGERINENKQISDAAPSTEEVAAAFVGTEESKSETTDDTKAKAPEDTKEEKKTEDEPAKQDSKGKRAGIISLLAIVLVAAGIGVGYAVGTMNNNTPSAPSSPETSSESTGSVPNIAGISDFDFKILKLKNTDENVVYSPLSIKYALAMLADGAAGESKTQITNLIGDYTPKLYTNSENLAFANAMFVRNDRKDNILSTYTDTLQQKFGAEVLYEPFTSVEPFNNWASDHTLGIIKSIVTDDDIDADSYFMLLNALAIDMNWNNQLQCKFQADKAGVPCKMYNVKFAHENYTDRVKDIGGSLRDFENMTFANNSEVKSATIGATANRYDIIKELGRDHIVSTVLQAYDEWVTEVKNSENYQKYPDNYDLDFDIDKYMEELGANYGQVSESTDFYFYDGESEKVFSKDLQTYDDTALQYVGVMPKNASLAEYIKDLSADKIRQLVNEAKDASVDSSYEDGVVTKISGQVPFFNFSHQLKLKEDLKALGITDVFSPDDADLSNMTTLVSDTAPSRNSYIQVAVHKADIDFSNDGIRAAAATALVGGMGAGGLERFDYKWDVPVKEVNMTFDQPFMFLIIDKGTGEVWFTGTVNSLN